MSFDFLSAIMSVPSIISNFSGDTTDPYKKQKKRITDAMGDTNNPLYRQLYGQYRQDEMTGLSEGIAEAQRQNRLANRMGRTPLFSQERGGEQMFRALMGGYQSSGVNANKSTQANLQKQLKNYGEMEDTTALGNFGKLQGYKNIENILRNLRRST